MTALLRRYSTAFLISLLLVLLILGWLFPSAKLMLGIILLLFSFAVVGSVVLAKHRQAYLQGRITRRDFIRNTILEIDVIWLTMILAGLLGKYIAEIATESIGNDLTKFVAGIVIGLLIGLGVGILAGQMQKRFVKTSYHPS